MSQRSAHVKQTVKMPKREVGAFDLSLIVRLVVAAALLAAALFVQMNGIVRVILLILSAAAAGYDIVLEAINAVDEGKYFATPLVIVFVVAMAFVSGYSAEAAALVILFQIGRLLIQYVDTRTKRSAMDLVRGQDEETIKKIKELLGKEDAGQVEMESTILHSATFVLRLVMVFALVYAIVLPLLSSGVTFRASIHRALIIILISTPLSVVTAMPLTGLVALCFGAQQGVLFHNAKTMEKCAGTNVVLFDKAGVFAEDCPRVLSQQSEVLDEKTFMNFLAHATYYSEQPFAKAISAVYDQEYKLDVISDFEEIPGSGVMLKIGNSPVILATGEYLTSKGVAFPQQPSEDGLAYYLIIAGRYIGRVVVSSGVNADAVNLVEGMHAAGIGRCVLLTEDSAEESQRIANELQFDEAHGECDTAKKLAIIRDISAGAKNKAMFVYANGIEGHSEAAVDVRVSNRGKYADALVAPEFAGNLPFAVQICRRMQEILKENAIFAIVIKALLVFLAMTGYCNLWFAIFLDMVATLFTQLNAIRVTTPSLLHRGKKEIEVEDE